MKKLMMAALGCAIWATVSHAQDLPKADFAVGYSLLFLPKGFILTMNGGSVAAAFPANHWLGVVGDFGAYDGSPGIPGLVGETYTFGPRFSYRGWNRLAPFAQAVLVGGHANVANGGFSAQRTHLRSAAAQEGTLDSIAPADSHCAGSSNFSISVRTPTSLRIPIPVRSACRLASCFASARDRRAVHSWADEPGNLKRWSRIHL